MKSNCCDAEIVTDDSGLYHRCDACSKNSGIMPCDPKPDEPKEHPGRWLARHAEYRVNQLYEIPGSEILSVRDYIRKLEAQIENYKRHEKERWESAAKARLVPQDKAKDAFKSVPYCPSCQCGACKNKRYTDNLTIQSNKLS